MADPHTDPGVPAHGLGPAGLRVSVPDRLGTVVDGPLFLSKIPFFDIWSNQGDTRIKTQNLLSPFQCMFIRKSEQNFY